MFAEAVKPIFSEKKKKVTQLSVTKQPDVAIERGESMWSRT